jgi:hypothetical protein
MRTFASLMDFEREIMECKMEMEETINALITLASHYKLLDIIIPVPEKCGLDRKR